METLELFKSSVLYITFISFCLIFLKLLVNYQLVLHSEINSLVVLNENYLNYIEMSDSVLRGRDYSSFHKGISHSYSPTYIYEDSKNSNNVNCYNYAVL